MYLFLSKSLNLSKSLCIYNKLYFFFFFFYIIFIICKKYFSINKERGNQNV